MDPNQGYNSPGGWNGGVWNPAAQNYAPGHPSAPSYTSIQQPTQMYPLAAQNQWQQHMHPTHPTEITQQLHQQLQHAPPPPPPTQYNPQPAPQLFCCEMCQRLAVPTTQTIHAYTTRLAFFVNHVMHPTVATYAQYPNRQIHDAFFDVLPLTEIIPPSNTHGGHTSSGQGKYQAQGQQQRQSQVQQQGQPRGINPNYRLSPPSGPSMIGYTHYTPSGSYYQANYQAGAAQYLQQAQQGYGQKGDYQGALTYVQHGNQQNRHIAHNTPPTNPPPQSIIGPIMFSGSSYSIHPHIPIALPNFVRPTIQLNVKFRLERYRLDPPTTVAPAPVHDENASTGGNYQSTSSPFIAPSQSTAITVRTSSPRSRENMELIWYYWPVQLEVPLWARGQNTDTNAPEIGNRLIREGIQIINGERWGFMDDREDREGLWHKRRSYKVLECPVHNMLWKVTVFVRRGY